MKRIDKEPPEMTMATEQKVLSHRMDYLEMKDAEKEKRINELEENNILFVKLMFPMLKYYLLQHPPRYCDDNAREGTKQGYGGNDKPSVCR